ncbi:hypothetical protein CC2G_004348 [Coprinopsis cinerea AmutBmut pab1-1]|nr:hypothetical protein CC2G_004348 [Coprinopsis cinerea AmutBmut pab1-1]
MPAIRFIRSPRKVVRYTPILRELKGLLFNTSNTFSVVKGIPTLTDPSGPQRFPCLEAVLGTRVSIHECVVEVTDRAGDLHQFLVACQNGLGLSRNRAVQRLLPPTMADWDGSIVVLKIGLVKAYVSMTTPDRVLAEEAVSKFFQACVISDELDVFNAPIRILPHTA